MIKILISSMIAMSISLLASEEVSNIDNAPKISKEKAQSYMKESMGYLKPPLKKVVGNLSKETKETLLKIYTHHDRHSKMATLRQVMQEVGRDYETMVSGLFMDNPEMAADAARRLANHRIPKGGLISYLEIKDINDGQLAGLNSMNSEVEGNALKFAKAVDDGDMLKASEYLTPIANGCISCHSVFRGKPGLNENIIN